jgi:hypothetical protein
MTALLAGCQSAPDMDVEQQVDALYQKMPQEERIAQLKSMYMDELFDEQGQLDTVKCRELIPFGIGHFSQFALQKPRDPNVVRDMVAAVQKWLMENCQDYGFILRYPEDKQDITGIIYEPWHYRYVGKDNAAKIKESGKCLEEYLGRVDNEKDRIEAE